MNKVKAKGQLQHHFWGDYHASIVLVFDDAKAAQDALNVLDGWKAHKKEPRALEWFGKEEAFKLVKAKLVELGADEKKIDSIAKSIDYGEPFTVTISIVPKEQASLF